MNGDFAKMIKLSTRINVQLICVVLCIILFEPCIGVRTCMAIVKNDNMRECSNSTISLYDNDDASNNDFDGDSTTLYGRSAHKYCSISYESNHHSETNTLTLNDASSSNTAIRFDAIDAIMYTARQKKAEMAQDINANEGANLKSASSEFAIVLYDSQDNSTDPFMIGTSNDEKGEWIVVKGRSSKEDKDKDVEESENDGLAVKGYLWRTHLYLPDAESITIAFSPFILPASLKPIMTISDSVSGNVLYITKPSERSPASTFTFSNQTGTQLRRRDLFLDSGHLTPALPSDDVVIEIFIPMTDTLQNVMQGNLEPMLNADKIYHSKLTKKVRVQISRVYYGFKSSSGGPSGKCNIDVNCAPKQLKRIGSGWENPKEAASVVQIVSAGPQSATSCTGTLVNSVSTPGRQFILTAVHCIWMDPSFSPFGWHFWGFLFKHEAPECAGPGSKVESWGQGDLTNVPLSSQEAYVQGAVLKSIDLETDVALFELISKIPKKVKPYFSGWDARDDIDVRQGVCIHHPAGDYKKISIEEGPLRRECWCGELGEPSSMPWTSGDSCPCVFPTHWVAQWEYGTTEPGSSGSSLFDGETRRVIGILSGGSASCSYAKGSDDFGMLRVAFKNTESLKQLLAGSDTSESQMFVDGSSSVEPVLYPNQYLKASSKREIYNEVKGIFEVELITDDFPGEVLWALRDSGGEIIGSGVGTAIGNSTADGLLIPYTYAPIVLDRVGTYNFTIYDTRSDGICCEYGNGRYSLLFNGEQIFESDGQYGFEESFEFVVLEPPEETLTTGSTGKVYGNVTISIEATKQDWDIYWAIVSENAMYAVGHMNGQFEVSMYRCGDFLFNLYDFEGDESCCKNNPESGVWTLRLGSKIISRGLGFESRKIVPFTVPCE